MQPHDYDAALALLRGSEFVEISDGQVTELSHRSVDSASLLDAEIAGEVEYAEEREKWASNPAFSNSARSLKDMAQLQRDHAAYLEKQKGSLRPYLVKIRSCYDYPRCVMSIDLVTRKLDIAAICPPKDDSARPMSTKIVPFIVFVEAKVREIKAEIEVMH